MVSHGVTHEPVHERFAESAAFRDLVIGDEPIQGYNLWNLVHIEHTNCQNVCNLQQRLLLAAIDLRLEWWKCRRASGQKSRRGAITPKRMSFDAPTGPSARRFNVCVESIKILRVSSRSAGRLSRTS